MTRGRAALFWKSWHFGEMGYIVQRPGLFWERVSTDPGSNSGSSTCSSDAPHLFSRLYNGQAVQMKEMMPSLASAHQVGASLGGEQSPRQGWRLDPASLYICSLQVRLRCSSSATPGDSFLQAGKRTPVLKKASRPSEFSCW